MGAESRRSIAIGITGASGAVYATRTVAALLAQGVHVELIVSDYGRRLLRDELGDAANLEQLVPYLKDRYGADVARGSINLHSNRDLGATIASGSHGCSGMAIVPCSMKTLAAIAHGLSRNLIERAADVMLKERRALVIVPRETPMSLPQLRNMDHVEQQMRDVTRGLIFTNLVDFDTQYGHRNDVAGYAANLERFDRRLAEILPILRPDDLLIVTADHGNDPSTPSTDHSREYVPPLVTGSRVRRNVDLGTRRTFADVGQTLAGVFEVGPIANGTSFLAEITG